MKWSIALGVSLCLATSVAEGQTVAAGAPLFEIVGVEALQVRVPVYSGDIDGVPDCVIQVANWSNVGAAVSQKPAECERQAANAGTTFGATFVRIRGGRYVVALTPEQWACLYREARAT